MCFGAILIIFFAIILRILEHFFFFFFLTDLTLNVFYGIFLVFRVFFFLSIIVEFSERKFGIIEVGLHQTHNTCAQRCRDVLRAARKC